MKPTSIATFFPLGTALMMLLGLLALSTSVDSSPATSDCQSQWEGVKRATDQYYELSTSASLDAALLSVEQFRRCADSGDEETLRGALNYETYLLIEARRFADARRAFQALDSLQAGRADAGTLYRLFQRRGYLNEITGHYASAYQDYLRSVELAQEAGSSRLLSVLTQAVDFLITIGETAEARRLTAIGREEIERQLAGDGQLPETILVERGHLYLKEADLYLIEANGHPHGAERDSLLDITLARVAESNRILSRELYGQIQSVEQEHERVRLAAVVTSFYAQCLLARGDTTAALEMARLAVDRARAAGGSQELVQAFRINGRVTSALYGSETAYPSLAMALEVAQAGAPRLVPLLLTDLGRAALASHSGGWPGEEARFYFQAALEIVESHRWEVGAREIAAAALTQWSAPYRWLAHIAAMQGNAEEALQMLDRGQGELLERLRRRSIALSDDDRVRLDSLGAAIVELRHASMGDTLTHAQRATLERQISGLEGIADSIVPRSERPLLDVQELKAHLQRTGKFVVNYLFMDDVMTVLVTSGQGISHVRLPMDASDLQRLIIEALPDGGVPASRRAEVDLSRSFALYQLVWKPIEHLVPEGARVTVVPDAPLNVLPLGMLVTSAPERFGYPSADYLIRRHAISSELAASLVLATPLQISRPRLTAFGNSNAVFSDQVALGSLPNAPAEALAASRHFHRGKAHLDQDATKEALFAALQHDDVVHVAAHATVLHERPNLSALFLSASALDDGVVRWFELRLARVQAKLVVLSACESGIGNDRRGEGLQGLHYALRAAGAGSSIATVWQVDDEASLFLMQEFYRLLARGEPSDIALQRAQIAYLDRHHGLLASPFFWAAPVLSGPPVQFSSQAPNPIAWALAGALLILFARLLSLKRPGATL